MLCYLVLCWATERDLNLRPLKSTEGHIRLNIYIYILFFFVIFQVICDCFLWILFLSQILKYPRWWSTHRILKEVLEQGNPFNWHHLPKMSCKEPVSEDSSWLPLGITRCESLVSSRNKLDYGQCSVEYMTTKPSGKPSQVHFWALLNAHIWLIFKVN